ncbi:sulfotransferase 6B1 [Austrofundulus limnaeus]|uniref:Sulfotransferase n=1 Tax=Austrofundulus limnaeus TaxID=52670 RepID=A0A2I4CSI8_AUSLI|nr:PREDICTED: sulfotransferase 6B1-like [Austrofundulus limnaeus]XP_013882952.1 PREDICTED: sulfotransferase 6B1-like [Austrofundulus limnaeus]
MSDDMFKARMQARLEKAKAMTEEEKLYRFNGVLYPTLMCPEENFKCLDNIKAREDDIMLAAYPKCGFNWMVGVLKKIMAEGTGNKNESKMPPMMEFFGPELLKVVEGSPSPRLLGTHLCPDNIPKTFKEKNPKILVVFRNPKDTLVSYFHFCNSNPVLPSKPWDSFFTDFMSGNVAWGSYFDYALAWDKRMDDPQVLVITYEELKQDLTSGVRQISTFFGFSLTDAQIQQITGASSFNAMKESSANSHGNMGQVFFRKGEVGDWKNHFTPEQSQEMDEAFNKHLAGTKLGDKLNYKYYCQ